MILSQIEGTDLLLRRNAVRFAVRSPLADYLPSLLAITE